MDIETLPPLGQFLSYHLRLLVVFNAFDLMLEVVSEVMGWKQVPPFKSRVKVYVALTSLSVVFYPHPFF